MNCLFIGCQVHQKPGAASGLQKGEIRCDSSILGENGLSSPAPPHQEEEEPQRSAQVRVQIPFQVKEVYVDGGVNVFGLLWAYVPKFPPCPSESCHCPKHHLSLNLQQKIPAT